MKKAVIIIAIIFAIIIIIPACALLFYTYYGGFKKVTVVQGERSDMYIAYKLNKGDYSESYNPMKEVEKYLKNEMMIESPESGIGIYFDEQGSVDVSEQRYAAGYIITEELYNAMIENNMNIKKAYFPAFEAVYATFPYKGLPSLFVAPDRIYPEISKYLEDNSILPNASIEIYDKGSRLIHVYIPTDISTEDIETLFDAPLR